MEKKVIAIDGPAGSGKSTISKIIADKLNIKYIDTGAMYRAVTLEILNKNMPFEEGTLLDNLLKSINIELDKNSVFMNNKDITNDIRMPFVNNKVSITAAIPSVRKRLVEIQRDMAKEESVIMDGRDIGTNVLPDAKYKIFLTASIEDRTNRRYKEMIDKNISISYQEVMNDIKNRDNIDSTRKVNPLRKAEDAITVDTSGKNIEQVVDEILSIIK